MSTDTHKAAFAAAAAAAQELMAGKQAARAKIASQLAAMDDEIARLQVVIDFGGGAIAPAAAAAPQPKGNWVQAIVTVLGAQPRTFEDLVSALRTQHGFTHSKMHIQKLLQQGEKTQRLYRDEERRWHVRPAPAAGNGVRKTPWHALPGATP